MYTQKIRYKCKLLTPLFLFGPNQKEPEFRMTAVKGALRFWWRALNANLNDLKDKENDIFGDTKQKSKVLLKLEKRLSYDGFSRTVMLPSKFGDDDGFKVESFPIGNSAFQISATISHQKKYKNLPQDIDQLFKCFCILGGIGKRSRRGFGSIKILETKWNDEDWKKYQAPETLEDIQKELLGNRFQYFPNQNIIRPKEISSLAYPHILSVELGAYPKTGVEVTTKIIADASKTNKKNKWNYKVALGSGKPRFASPIYVSVIDTQRGKRSIITTLKTVPNPDFREPYDEQKHGTLQKEYKDLLKQTDFEN